MSTILRSILRQVHIAQQSRNLESCHRLETHQLCVYRALVCPGVLRRGRASYPPRMHLAAYPPTRMNRRSNWGWTHRHTPPAPAHRKTRRFSAQSPLFPDNLYASKATLALATTLPGCIDTLAHVPLKPVIVGWSEGVLVVLVVCAEGHPGIRSMMATVHAWKLARIA